VPPVGEVLQKSGAKVLLFLELSKVYPKFYEINPHFLGYSLENPYFCSEKKLM